MGAFSGLKGASRGFQSNPLRDGDYVCRIDSCDFFDTEQNGEMWKNTLTVLAVIDGDHKVGEVVHTFFRVKAGTKTFQQNLKSFIAGVLACEDDAIGEDEVKTILGKVEGVSNPMQGLVTRVTGRRRTSKKTVDKDSGEPVQYTVYSWSAMFSGEQIAEALGKDEELIGRFFPNGLPEAA